MSTNTSEQDKKAKIPHGVSFTVRGRVHQIGPDGEFTVPAKSDTEFIFLRLDGETQEEAEQKQNDLLEKIKQWVQSSKTQ